MTNLAVDEVSVEELIDEGSLEVRLYMQAYILCFSTVLYPCAWHTDSLPFCLITDSDLYPLSNLRAHAVHARCPQGEPLQRADANQG